MKKHQILFPLVCLDKNECLIHRRHFSKSPERACECNSLHSMISQIYSSRKIAPWLVTVLVLFAVSSIVLVSIAVNLILIVIIASKHLNNPKPDHRPTHNLKNTKYLRSGLSKDIKRKYSELLEKTMHQKRSYLNASITLPALSDETGIPQNYLSQIINETYKKNFYDYINEFRINQAMKLLSDPEKSNLSIMNILHDVGFNSKSTFYTAFSKETGMTPRKYRMRHLRPPQQVFPPPLNESH